MTDRSVLMMRKMKTMEFKEAMRIWKRMCAAHKTCSKCGLATCDPAMCRPWVYDNPVEAEAILAKWAEEHPEKTIADDFFDKHPKAPKNPQGRPRTCAEDCGYVSGDQCNDDCVVCWRRPLEGVEG